MSLIKSIVVCIILCFTVIINMGDVSGSGFQNYRKTDKNEKKREKYDSGSAC